MSEIVSGPSISRAAMTTGERCDIVRALVAVALGICDRVIELELVAMLLGDALNVLDDPCDLD